MNVAMERNHEKRTVRTPVSSVLKVLLVMYILTGIFLVILAALLYKFELSESAVNIAVIVIYVLIGFIGGFLAGKILKVRKFMWGAVTGALYFLILIGVSFAMHKGLSQDVVHFATTLVLCVASGTAGGMVS